MPISTDARNLFFRILFLFECGRFVRQFRITANACYYYLIKFRIGTSTEAHNLCRSSVVSPRLANTDCKSKKNFRNNKKSGEKCCATFATFATFSVLGVSLIVTHLKGCHVSLLPLQGVSRFATPLHKGWGKSGFLGIISVSVATVGF